MLLPANLRLWSAHRDGNVARDEVYDGPSACAWDSLTAHPKMPLAIVDASASTRRSFTSARAPCTMASSGAASAASSAR